MTTIQVKRPAADDDIEPVVETLLIESGAAVEVEPGQVVVILGEDGQPMPFSAEKQGGDLLVTTGQGESVTFAGYFVVSSSNPPVLLGLTGTPSSGLVFQTFELSGFGGGDENSLEGGLFDGFGLGQGDGSADSFGTPSSRDEDDSLTESDRGSGSSSNENPALDETFGNNSSDDFFVSNNNDDDETEAEGNSPQSDPPASETNNEEPTTAEPQTPTVEPPSSFSEALPVDPGPTNAPPQLAPAALNLDENASNATVVGSASATDPESTPLTYSITGGNPGGAFAIDPTTGEITVADSTALDFETTPTFDLQITATDAGGATDTAVYSISLNDLDEVPVFEQSGPFSIAEDAANTGAVGDVNANDGDGGATDSAVTYSITSGDPDGVFTIDAATGEITVADNTTIDFETTPSYNLTVQADDGVTQTDESIIVNVTDVEDSEFSITALDSAKAEGDTGTTEFTFTVTRGEDTSGPATVDYAVTGTGANPADADDFGGAFPTGTVNFADGETTQTVTIQISGDAGVELDENFSVTLDNPSGAGIITTSEADGTIQNDDTPAAPAVWINEIHYDNASGDVGEGVEIAGAAGTDLTGWTVVLYNGDDGTQYGSIALSGTIDDERGGFGALGRFDGPASGIQNGSPDGLALVDATGTVVEFLSYDGTFTASGGPADGMTSVDLGVLESGSTPAGFSLQRDNSDPANPKGDFQSEATDSFGSLNELAEPAPEFSIAATTAVQAEGDSGTTLLTFTVTRDINTTGAATVDFEVSGDADAFDFGGTLPGGTVTFGDGEATQTITLEVIGDTDIELDEDFTVTLSNPSTGSITTATAAGTIVNDDIAATFAIAQDTAILSEGDTGTTAFTFTVTRSGNTSGEATLDYAITGDADAADFGGAIPSGQVTFADGEATQTITVEVTGDSDLETDEGFTVTLTNPSTGSITTATADGTIQNDDLPSATFEIVATDATKNEGDTGTTPFTFTVTRSGSAVGEATLDYAVGGSADAADFGGALPTGQVTFADGETTQTITLNVNGDASIESDEDFTVTLTDPSTGSITTNSATGTILNDDIAPPRFSIAATDAVKEEGDSGTTAFTFTITRTGDTSEANSVDYTVSAPGLDQAQATDFGTGHGFPRNVNVSFAAGETSKEISVQVKGDYLVESDEGFIVTLSNPSGFATLGASSAAGTILNDDTVPYVIINEVDSTANFIELYDGGSGDTSFGGIVLVLFDGATDTSYATYDLQHLSTGADGYLVIGSASTPNVDFVIPDGLLQSGADAVAIFRGTASDFPTGTPATNVNLIDGIVYGTDDAEDSELTTIFGTPQINENEHGSADSDSISRVPNETGDFATQYATPGADNIVPLIFSIEATEAVKLEGNADTTPFTFTITRVGDTSGAVSVNYSVTGDVDAADFGGTLPTEVTVNFADGEDTQLITIDVSGDVHAESYEDFTVTLSNPSAGTIDASAASAEGTIGDDDDPLEGGYILKETFDYAENGEAAQFTVSDVSGSASFFGENTSKDYLGVYDGDGDGGVDFGGDSQPSIIEDYTGFDDNFLIGADLNGGSPSINVPATLTWSNLDITGLTELDFSVDIATNTIDSTLDITDYVHFEYSIDGGPFQMLMAFESASGTKYNLPTFLQDTDFDGIGDGEALTPDAQTFTSNFAVSGSKLELRAHLRIDAGGEDIAIDNVFLKKPIVEQSFAIAADQVALDEGDTGTTEFTFTVTRSGNASGAATLDYSVVGSGANAADAADFGGTLPSGQVSFADGETTQTITVQISGDSSVETGEEFTVNLTSTDTGTITTDSASSIITNDDIASDSIFSIAATNAVLAEGDTGATAFTFEVTRAGGTTGNASVDYSISGDVDATDFGGTLPTDVTVNFADGEDSKIITINVSGDTDIESDQDFTVTLSNPSTGTLDAEATAADGTIIDDDAPPPNFILEERFDYAENNEAAQFTISDNNDAAEFFGEDSSRDYLGVYDGDRDGGSDFGNDSEPTIIEEYTGFDDNYFIASDLDGGSPVLAMPVTLAWTNLDISGLSELDFSVDIATNTRDSTLDPNDYVRFIYSVDGGSFQKVMMFETDDATVYNRPTFLQDTDFDGVGDGTALDSALQTFTNTFSVSGSTLELRAVIRINAGGEDVAIDNILIKEAVADSSATTFAIAADQATLSEGDSGTTDFTFTVTRSGDTSGEATVDYALNGEADTADFGGTMPSGTVTFGDGETSRTITLQVSGDAEFETDETLTVTLSNQSIGTITTAAASGTILNDDTAPAPVAWINEIHYDNVSGDVGEGIEIAGEAGTDLTGWTVALYNGGDGGVYGTINLSGTIDDEGTGFGATERFDYSGIQNGSPDGLALVNASGTVVEFLSYEGAFTATDGPANGQTSVDVGVAEGGETPENFSLQRDNSDDSDPYGEFQEEALNSFGSLNEPSTPEAPASTATPVILDLDGDGVELTSINDGILFDIDGDGADENVAWVGSDDALLVFDYNGDGQVNDKSEFVLTNHVAGTNTDLEALRLGFDSDNDGYFTAADDDWDRFGLWQDANADGISDEGEFSLLDAAGIASIDLTGNGPLQVVGGGDSLLYGTSEFVRTDGSTGTVGDVAFGYTEVGNVDVTSVIEEPEAELDLPAEQSAPVDAIATHEAPTTSTIDSVDAAIDIPEVALEDNVPETIA